MNGTLPPAACTSSCICAQNTTYPRLGHDASAVSYYGRVVLEIRRLAVHHLIRCFFLLVAGLLACGTAAAQVYPTWHRPLNVDYREFSTPHFRMIYQSGLRSEAAEMADLLERSLPEVRAFVGLRRPLHVPIVLNRFTDNGNGFVTAMPFRQEIEAIPLRGSVLSPRFRSWFETVAPHELVHAAHAESGRGFGIGWMLRRLGPDLARSLNLSAPRGINEGAAVWFESQIRPGSGRLNHSLFEMEFRAAMLSDDPLGLAQMLEPPSYTRPYDRYYHGGAHLFEYMSRRNDLAFFRRARTFYYRFPLLGFGPALWYGTGMPPWALGRRMRAHFRAEASEFLDVLGDVSQPEVIASKRGTIHRRPVWIDKETLLVYARGYHLRPGFYKVDARSGSKQALAHEAITGDFLYTLDPDTASVLYSRFVLDTFEAIRAVSEVFRLDLSSGKSTRITRGGRSFGPVAAPDGLIWALRSDGQFHEWVEIGADGGVAGIQTFDRTAIVSVLPSPDGSRTVALVNHEGKQGIIEVDPSAGPEPLIIFRDASIFDMSWSRDGAYLLFSADPGGVSNIHAWEVGTGRVYRLTNVAFGAIEPSLSPDGSTLAFVNYRHERYDLVRMPFAPGQTDIVPAADLGWGLSATTGEALSGSTSAVRGKGLTYQRESVVTSQRESVAASQRESVAASQAESAFAAHQESAYRPLLEVRPRIIYPFLQYQLPTGDDDDVHLGLGAGVGLEWADPLQYWSAHTSAFYRAESLWGRLRVQSGRFLLRPSAEVFREPSTVVVQISEGTRIDTVRVGRDERAVSLGVRLPAVFEANVFQTTAVGALTGEYRREWLFDHDGERLTAPDARWTIRPSLQVAYRIQANTRDLVPNSGLRLAAFSMLDLWSEGGRPARYVRAQGDLYLPYLRSTSTGLAVQGSLHAQNRGGIVNLSSFFPRGYEAETVFLDGGVYGKLGFEVTQPLWYIDDGFVLLPLFFRALFAYGFVESMQPLSGAGVRRTVIGGGLGLQARFAHGLNVTLRVAPTYRWREGTWALAFR